jgi:hypothetical protein
MAGAGLPSYPASNKTHQEITNHTKHIVAPFTVCLINPHPHQLPVKTFIVVAIAIQPCKDVVNVR